MASCVHAAYNRLELLSLYTAVGPIASVAVRVRELGLWSACRLRCFDSHWRITRPSDGRLDGAFLCNYRGNHAGRSKRRNRHASPKAADVNFGCFNVRSLENKIDALLDVRHDRRIDVLFLVETWLDHDSVCLRRLTADGYQVEQRSRP
jgi:hypothetical protein